MTAALSFASLVRFFRREKVLLESRSAGRISIAMDRSGERFTQVRALIAGYLSAHLRGKIRCVFLIHHAPAWEAVAGVYAAMRKAPDFDPIVISIHRDFEHKQNYYGEEDVHNRLEKEGVPHLRFSSHDFPGQLENLKALEPHIIFRQAPWELDLPSAFHTGELTFAHLCYVPYFANMILSGREEHDFDQHFHRTCWRIFCVSQFQFDLLAGHARSRGVNGVVTGHPKFDRLLEARTRPAWPIDRGARHFRVIWAAHHSVHADWLGFGVFPEIHGDMLRFAKQHPDIEIVFSPHPMLFESNCHGAMTGEQIEAFKNEWNALPNTALIGQDVPYPAVFAASDAMIADGISFLTEYQIFNKPLVFFDSQRHEPFNKEGEALLRCLYRVTSTEEAFQKLVSFKETGVDPLESSRQELLKTILPFPGKAAQRVLSEVRSGLAR